jgi:cation diffusion facilitator CzcD-associated flavoprotein CzcO
MAQSTDVAIIGAGPAGLAVGACLRKAGRDFVMLEKEAQIAPAWRRHYERLHLHTVKQLSSLPYRPFPAHYPRYVPRDLMIAYLEAYATAFGLAPRFGETVHAVQRAGNGWSVEAATGRFEARHVVVASGFNAEPVVPSVPGLESFEGKVLHSADYLNARPFAGRSVLVVGMGNSGAEIALDLCEGGARTSISLRGGVHIAPRDLFGVPIQVVALLATGLLPSRVNDAIFPVILDAALGFPSRHGLRRPKQGILRQIGSAGKIPVLDVGTVRRIADGTIGLRPRLSTLGPDSATFTDGRNEQFDAIVFATGYRPACHSFLDAGVGPGSADRTLHFVGFRNVVTGLIREISREAVRVAATIATA